MREAAREQARGVSSAITIGASVVLAVVGVLLFALLDYQFGQATHRLIKILIGVSLFSAILMWPRIGLFLFPVMIPFLPWFPQLGIPGINPLNVLLGSVFLTWALHRVLHRLPIFRKGTIAWALAAILAVAGLSVVRGGAFPTGYTYDVPYAIQGLFRCTVTFATYFIALAMARGERDRKLLTWAIVIGLLAESITTIAYGRNGRGGRAIGTLGQSNELGAFLAMYSVLAASLLVGVRNAFGRLVLLGSVVAGCFGIVLSLSRGSMIALVAGLLFVSVKSSKWLGLLLIAVLVASPLWAPDYLKRRITQPEEEMTQGQLDNASQQRVDTWRAIGQLVSDHPVDGVGFCGLEFVLPATGEELGLEVQDTSHNTFLRFLGEMGIFGLGLFCFLLWKCWKLGIDGARAARTAFDRQLSIGLSAVTIVMATSCAFGDRFFSILLSGGFWFMCALVDDLLIERREAAT
jgi:O-antigen ligase